MRSVRWLAVIPVALICVLAGCVQPASAPIPDDLHAGYLKSGANCSTLDRLRAYAIKMGQSLAVRLGNKSDCLKVGPGINEPVQLLALPRSGRIIYVTVHTDMARLMLVPRIELLDGTRKELRVLTFKDMKSIGNGLTATFFVTPGKHRVDYILVYPDPSLTGDRRKHLKQGMDIGFYGLYSMAYGTSSQYAVTDVEQGTLEIRATVYHPPSVKQRNQTNLPK